MTDSGAFARTSTANTHSHLQIQWFQICILQFALCNAPCGSDTASPTPAQRARAGVICAEIAKCKLQNAKLELLKLPIPSMKTCVYLTRTSVTCFAVPSGTL